MSDFFDSKKCVKVELLFKFRNLFIAYVLGSHFGIRYWKNCDFNFIFSLRNTELKMQGKSMDVAGPQTAG